jgi:molybdate transport system substrate-binding protein
MSQRMRSPVSVLMAIVAVLVFATPSFAQLKVIISGGFAPAYREVLPEFERTTGISVITASGASRGNGPDTIGAQLRRGIPADVVIMNRPGLADLIVQGRIVAGTDVGLAQSLIGVAVRAGRPKPDISTTDAFRQALLSAKVVAVTGSDTSLITEVLPRLGIASKVTVKIASRGTASVAMVARGDAELAIQPVSEILHMPGVELVGAIPTEVQHVALYAAAIVAGSKEPEASKRLIAFLSSDRSTVAIKKSGLERLKRPSTR